MSVELTCRVERADSEAVAPLEVWQLELDGEPVRHLLRGTNVDGARERGVDERTIGRRIGRRAGRFASRLYGGGWAVDAFPEGQQPAARRLSEVDEVCFAGGLVRLAGFEDGASEETDDFWVLGEGVETAIRRGGVRVVEARPGPSPSGPVFVADVGQTAVETGVVQRRSGSGARVTADRRIERPFERLPIDVPEPEAEFAGEASGDREAKSAESIAFVAEAIAEGEERLERIPPAAVLALPSRVDDDLTPSVSTYPGWSAASDLVARIVRRSGLDREGREVHVLNDAELAGYAALVDMERRETNGEVFVMTLGFGPGGAIVDSEVDAGADDE